MRLAGYGWGFVFVRRAGAIAREVYREWKRDNATLLAAAVAFYGLFSVAPLLVLIVAASGRILGEEAARQQVVAAISRFVNERTALAVQRLLTAATDGDDAGVTIVSGVLLLFGASGVFRHLRKALNLVLDAPNDDTPDWKVALRSRLVGMVMVIVTLPVLLASVALTATLATIRNYVPTIPAADVALWRGVEIVASTLLVACIVASILKFVPNAKLKWRNVAFGASTAAVLFAAGRYGLGLYMSRTNVTSLYGAAASLFVVLVSMFLAVLVLFMAAEMTKVLVREDREQRRSEHGYSQRKPETPAGEHRSG